MKNKNFKVKFNKYLESKPLVKELFEELNKLGNIYLIGGTCRSYFNLFPFSDLHDLDIIVDCHKENLEKLLIDFISNRQDILLGSNIFNSFKINLDLPIDVWALEDSWMIHDISTDKPLYMRLLDIVTLNIDSIIYDYNNEELYDKSDKESKIIDLVNPKTPAFYSNLYKAIQYKLYDGYAWSNTLTIYFLKNVYKEESFDKVIHRLKEVQKNRYYDIVKNKRYIDFDNFINRKEETYEK